MTQTPNYGLRKPTDPAVPADFITIVGALADDTDAALGRVAGAKAGADGAGAYGTWGINITGVAGYAHSAGNADTVDGHHAAAFAGAGHGHNPSGSGISVIHDNLGTIGPGQEVLRRYGRSNDQFPVVSVNHTSSYLVAVVHSFDNGGFTIEVRNTTSGTTHTNVHVIIHLVRAA